MAEFVYGKNVVKELLRKGGDVLEVLMSSKDEEIERLAKKNNTKVIYRDKNELAKLTKTNKHQGVVAKIPDFKTYSLEEILSDIPREELGLLILLDELEDPHNLGAILRNADAVGAHGIIYKKTNSVKLSASVAKVSAGAINTVKCAEVTNLSRTLDELKDKGYWVVGTDMSSNDYRSLNYDFPVVLVIGNEGSGMSRLVREKCDYIVSIPMKGSISSLNASVSSGIVLYEILNKRFPL